jgi:hypothetical protein
MMLANIINPKNKRNMAKGAAFVCSLKLYLNLFINIKKPDHY